MSDKTGPYTTRELKLMPGHSFILLPSGLRAMDDSFPTGQAIRICNALNAAGAASKEQERDSAWIVEGCREAWKDGGFEDKDRADERFRTKYQTFAVGWMESRMRLIGPTPDPDAHLTGDADYLEAKQARFAEQPQSAEEREAYHAVNEASNELMWGKHPEPSKAMLTDERAMECARAMYSGDGDKMDAYAQGMRDARDNGYLSASKAILLPMGEEVDAILLSDCDNMYHEDHGSVMFATTDCVTKLFANTKAVSIEAIKKEVYQWRARHFNNPKEQADDLERRLNNLTK